MKVSLATMRVSRRHATAGGIAVTVGFVAAVSVAFAVPAATSTTHPSVSGYRTQTASFVVAGVAGAAESAGPSDPASRAVLVGEGAHSVGGVIPVAPLVTVSRCAKVAGLTLASTAGVLYSVAVAGPYTVGEVVLVHARAARGFSFTATPPGWTRQSGTQETYQLTLVAVAGCLTPVRPLLTQSHCLPGATPSSVPTLAMLDTPGIAYSAFPDGPYRVSQQVTITAVAQNGLSFAPVTPAGWVRLTQSVATYTVVFDRAPLCATHP